MNRPIDTHIPAAKAGTQPAPGTDHGKLLAMPESPMPDWSARNRTPDPFAGDAQDDAQTALKPAA